MELRQRPRSQRGYTILEVLIAVTVLAIVAQAFAVFVRQASRSSVSTQLKADAFEHAVQMLEELRSVVIDDNASIDELDKYNDDRLSNGDPVLKFTLTTKREVTHPGGNTQADHTTGIDKLSGNPLSSTGYKLVRHVEVSTDPVDTRLRRLRIRVWKASPNSGSSAASTAAFAAKLPLAEVVGTVRSLATGNRPSQVMDLYLVALENVPGWWSRTSNLIPLMRASIISLQSRNPGLVLRPHWIRRMSYGRDVEYTPEVNSATRSDADGAFKKAYVYPGLINYSDGDDYYYLPSWFKARVNIDGTIQTTSVDGYPIADQWNHAMRLPDEERLFAIHKVVNANRGAEAPEISLRMLLDKMNTPGSLELINSVVINLHGEMLPVLPLRNYSDAAKDPAQFWSSRTGTAKRAWRAVSHPEKLSYAAGSDVAFRVYAYDMNSHTYADPITSTVENDLLNHVTLFVPGANLGNLKGVERMQGNSNTQYKWVRHAAISSTTEAKWDYYPNTASYTAILDGSALTTAARWVADEYTPPNRNPGLRIRLYGVTTTARAYVAKPYIP